MAKMKQWGIGALVLLIALVTACGSTGGNNANGGSPSDGGGDGAGQKPTISIMMPLHVAETPDGAIEQLIEEKLNVNLDIQWIPATTYEDRMSAAFATGSLTDVVNIKMEGAYREAIKDGQFWEIGPYLDQFENLSKLKGEILDNMLVDGKLYSLYQGRPLSRQGLIFRKDWADNLGLSTPTTTDELYEMLKQFAEGDPDGNGQNDTIGLADRGDLASGAFKTLASWFGAPNEWGFDENGELAPWFMFSEYKEAMDFMKDLYDNGYINLDFAVTSKVDQQNMLKNGRAGAYIGCMCDVNAIYTDAVQLNPDVTFDVQNQIAGPSGEFTVWAIPGFNHPYLFPKSAVANEEELLTILEFFDGMMSPEIANLLYWGVEGEHYNVVDGKAVPITDQSKLGREVTPYQSLEVGEPDTNGRYAGSFEYDVYEKANQLFIDNEQYLVHNPAVALESETSTQYKERLDQIIRDATYNYILGTLDEEGFDKEVDRWSREGGALIIEELNASYQQASN